MRESGAIDSGFALLSHEDPQIRENAVSLIWAATSAHRTPLAFGIQVLYLLLS